MLICAMVYLVADADFFEHVTGSCTRADYHSGSAALHAGNAHTHLVGDPFTEPHQAS